MPSRAGEGQGHGAAFISMNELALRRMFGRSAATLGIVSRRVNSSRIWRSWARR